MGETETNGSYRVTTKDVFDAVNQLRDDLAPLKELPPKVDDHETRIRSLERARYMIIGIGLMIEVVVVPLAVVLLYHVIPQAK